MASMDHRGRSLNAGRILVKRLRPVVAAGRIRYAYSVEMMTDIDLAGSDAGNSGNFDSLKKKDGTEVE